MDSADELAAGWLVRVLSQRLFDLVGILLPSQRVMEHGERNFRPDNDWTYRNSLNIYTLVVVRLAGFPEVAIPRFYTILGFDFDGFDRTVRHRKQGILWKLVENIVLTEFGSIASFSIYHYRMVIEW